jgi:hypothetical protein
VDQLLEFLGVLLGHDLLAQPAETLSFFGSHLGGPLLGADVSAVPALCRSGSVPAGDGRANASVPT